jgi:phytoene dehydrogenase-like protein
LLKAPPNATKKGWVDAVVDLIGAAGLGRRLAKLNARAQHDLLALFAQSAGEMLDGWFESDPIKAVLGFDAIVGNYASPYAPSSAYVLLHHCIGETNGRKGVWGHAIGGMGAITQAMASACVSKGVRIYTGNAVKEVTTKRGRATGVVTEQGRVFGARAVVSNLNPKLLFGRLVDESLLAPEFRDRMAHYRCGSGTFRMNVALSELPRLTCLPEPGDHLTAGIIIGPSLAYFDRAYHDAKALGWSKEPIVEMLIPSTLDDTLAPKGRHVASLFCQHVAPELPDGKNWDDYRETVADLMIATVDRAAPGFKASVISRISYSPQDLERTFGLVGGDIMHGALTLDQIFSARPALGYASYRAPIPRLYMCGSGTHPGGGVTGAPGHNAAHEILKDFRWRRV